MKSIWAQNIWLQPQWIEANSIGHAAKELRSRHRLWWPYSVSHHRRTQLIQDALPHVSGKRAVFSSSPVHVDVAPPGSWPVGQLGSWSLFERGLVLASAQCTSHRPNGTWEFVEDKAGPPSRAYLKLWELFSRLDVRPRAGTSCLDVGSSPGGWTWALAQLGCAVLSVDRSALHQSVQRLPGVRFVSGDAFQAVPSRHPEVDWVFSDVVCYPERLYGWVQTWLSSRPRNFVCTIKLQGTDHCPWIDKFRRIPESTVLHLYHNKHELTWVCLLHSASTQRVHEHALA